MNHPALLFASLVALAVTLVPSLIYFFGLVSHDVVKITALIGTIAWFIVTPMWMGREPTVADKEVEI